MADSPSSADPIDLLGWFDAWGEELLRYAASRLRDPHLAEDLVQEAFLAAWKNQHQFAGQSSEKTWLIAILRRKLADHYRRELRAAASNTKAQAASVQPEEADVQESSADRPRHQPFDRRGHWSMRLKEWTQPADDRMQRAEFWHVLRACISKLPANAATAFIFRTMDQLETEQICGMLQITPGNLGVMLYRGRLALRHCLGKNWFGETPRESTKAKAKGARGS